MCVVAPHDKCHTQPHSLCTRCIAPTHTHTHMQGAPVSYLFVIPFVFWNVDEELGRSAMVLWALGYPCSTARRLGVCVGLTIACLACVSQHVPDIVCQGPLAAASATPGIHLPRARLSALGLGFDHTPFLCHCHAQLVDSVSKVYRGPASFGLPSVRSFSATAVPCWLCLHGTAQVHMHTRSHSLAGFLD